eukprot:gene6371-4596_t
MLNLEGTVSSVRISLFFPIFFSLPLDLFLLLFHCVSWWDSFFFYFPKLFKKIMLNSPLSSSFSALTCLLSFPRKAYLSSFATRERERERGVEELDDVLAGSPIAVPIHPPRAPSPPLRFFPPGAGSVFHPTRVLRQRRHVDPSPVSSTHPSPSSPPSAPDDPWGAFLYQLNGGTAATAPPPPAAAPLGRDLARQTRDGEAKRGAGNPQMAQQEQHAETPAEQPSNAPSREGSSSQPSLASLLHAFASLPLPTAAAASPHSPWSARGAPFYCTRLMEAHIIASALWYRHVGLPSCSPVLQQPPGGALPSRSSTQRDGDGETDHAQSHLAGVLAWWEEVQSSVLLPRDLAAMEDLPLFMRDVLGWSPRTGAAANGGRVDVLQEASAAEAAEEKLILQLQEWVLMNDATPVPAVAATAAAAQEGDALLDPGTTRAPPTHQGNDNAGREYAIEVWETISYPRLLGLLHSFVRYHKGVMWGVWGGGDKAPSPGSSKTEKQHAAAAYFSQRYFLHPWDEMFCPEGKAQQRPFVDVLLWMTRNRKRRYAGGAKAKAATPPLPPSGAFARHHPFDPPTPKTIEGGGFRALDICSQSGFGVDLLLKAGAAHILAVDAAGALAAANTQATLHEHERERRTPTPTSSASTSLGESPPRLQTMAADVLPDIYTYGFHLPNSNGGRGKEKEAAVAARRGRANVFAEAAARRRRAAWGMGQGLPPPAPVSSSAAAATPGAQDPFDLLFYHPPVPAQVFPFTPRLCPRPVRGRESTSTGAGLWWSTLRDEAIPCLLSYLPPHPPPPRWGGGSPAAAAAADGASPAPSASLALGQQEEERWWILPWIPVPAPRPHLHHSMGTLHELLRTIQRATAPPPHDPRAPPPPPLLRPDAYVIFVVPRSYHLLEEAIAKLSSAGERGSHRRTGGGGGAPPALHEEGRRLKAGPMMGMGNGAGGAFPPGSVAAVVCDALLDAGPSSSPRGFELVAHRRYPVLLPDGTAASRTSAPPPPSASAAAAASSWWSYLGFPTTAAQRLQRCIPPQWVDTLVFRWTPPASSSAQHQSSGGMARRGGELLRRCVSAGSSSVGSATQRNNNTQQQQQQIVPWTDTLEYDEYLPSQFPTHYHWLDRISTFSYLEEDFGPPPSAATEEAGRRARTPSIYAALSDLEPGPTGGQTDRGAAAPQLDALVTARDLLVGQAKDNVLAYGPLSMVRLQRAAALLEEGEKEGKEGDAEQSSSGRRLGPVPVQHWKPDADQAAGLFRSVFAEELRAKRSTKKFRRASLSASLHGTSSSGFARDHEEWYIDKHVMQSEKAKIELMNAIARFDFKFDEDH